jgi:hypothetical protein
MGAAVGHFGDLSDKMRTPAVSALQARNRGDLVVIASISVFAAAPSRRRMFRPWGEPAPTSPGDQVLARNSQDRLQTTTQEPPGDRL